MEASILGRHLVDLIRFNFLLPTKNEDNFLCASNEVISLHFTSIFFIFNL